MTGLIFRIEAQFGQSKTLYWPPKRQSFPPKLILVVSKSPNYSCHFDPKTVTDNKTFGSNCCVHYNKGGI